MNYNLFIGLQSDWRPIRDIGWRGLIASLDWSRVRRLMIRAPWGQTKELDRRSPTFNGQPRYRHIHFNQRHKDKAQSWANPLYHPTRITTFCRANKIPVWCYVGSPYDANQPWDIGHEIYWIKRFGFDGIAFDDSNVNTIHMQQCMTWCNYLGLGFMFEGIPRVDSKWDYPQIMRLQRWMRWRKIAKTDTVWGYGREQEYQRTPNFQNVIIRQTDLGTLPNIPAAIDLIERNAGGRAWVNYGDFIRLTREYLARYYH